MTTVYLLMRFERHEGETVEATFTDLNRAKEYAKAMMREVRGNMTDDGNYGLRWSDVYNDWATLLYIKTEETLD